MSEHEQFACPYCEASLNRGVLSCRSCGRDLSPVLPLLSRLDALQRRIVTLESALEEDRLARASEAKAAKAAQPAAPAAPAEQARPVPASHHAHRPVRRRFWVLPLGFAVVLGAYWMVVLWLDLPLWVLRFVTIAFPFVIGIVYFGVRPRLTWFDAGVSIVFALSAVLAMNALLGWIDNIPILPQGTAAWRETFFYALSIGASMFSGMLLRLSQAALSARGLMSFPRLRELLRSLNGNMPMDTLKAIELTILMVSTILTAITGLVAGLLGVK